MNAGTPSVPGASLDDSQFRALADTAPDAIITGDAAGTIAYVNAAAARLFAHQPADMIGAPITMLIPERLRDAHRAGLSRFVRTGRGRIVGTTVEFAAVRADGHEFPIELSLGTTGEGPARILTAVIRDLTDRRRRERHLAAQLAVTTVLAGPQSAAETAPRIVEELTRALGWDVGMLWLLEQDSRLRLRHAWQLDVEATRDLTRVSAEFELEAGQGLPGLTLAAGAPVWHDDIGTAEGFLRADEARVAGLHSSICLPLMAGGRVLGVIECFARERMPVDDRLRDLLMTVASQVGEHLQRLEAQERLEEARARFTTAFEHAPIGMALVSGDGRWLDVNPALCRLTGYAPDDLLAGTFADITHPDDLQADTELVARALAGEIDSYQLEKRYIRASGEVVWVLLSVSTVRQPTGTYFIAQIQDITAARLADDMRARHAAELERSNADLQEFADVAAHDLRAPVRTIAGFAELLKRRCGERLGDEGREFLGLIIDSAKASDHLLSNLLSYARAGAFAPPTELVDTRGMVEGVMVALRSDIDARDAQVELGDLAPVVADRVQLAQAFQNLIGNAIKYVPDDRRPQVRITSRREGSMQRFSVADNGVGVQPEEAAGLFEMFGRGTHDTPYEGSGIGLAVCAKIVRRHGGRLEVAAGPDGGSVFSFTLPASPGRAAG